MNRVTVKIANKEYIITGEQKKEYILQVASHVDERMEQIKNANPRLNAVTVAVLTAVNIAEEYYTEVRKNTELNRVLKEPEKELESLRKRVSELEKIIVLKEEEIKGFGNTVETFNQKIEKMLSEKEEADNLLQEKEIKLKEAEEIVNDSQNRLYDLQLKVIGLEEKLGGEQ